MDFADFAKEREPVREFLGLKGGPPSHDTFSRVFRLLDPAAFGRVFGAFLDDLGVDSSGVLAIDGKTLRRSFDRAAERSALHVVTAFGAEARLVIGQRATASKENEAVAARALLETLTLEGALVTGRTHAERDGRVRAGEGRRLPLRAHGQPAADDAGRRGPLRRPARAPPRLRDNRRGPRPPGAPPPPRQPGRGLAILRPRLPDAPRTPGLATIACVEAERTGEGRTTRAVRYYVSSAVLTPERFAAAVRAYWAIENSLHWVLDMAFDEDRARNRKDTAAENLAILRKLALNVMRKARPGVSIRRKRNRSGWSDAFARSVIGQMG